MTENLPVPEWFNAKAILAQVIEGKTTEEIAKRLGIKRDKLHYFLTTRAPDDWKEAVLIRALRRQDEAENEIDTADDMLKLRKAETKLKSAQWNLERVCRRIYGDVKEQPDQPAVMIAISLRRNDDARIETGRTIEPAVVLEMPEVPEESLPSPLPAPQKVKQVIQIPASPTALPLVYSDNGIV